MSYNGWPNWETWNVALWAGNDPATHATVEENQPYTAEKAERIAREIWPQGTRDMDGPEDMDAVDWERIAEAWNEK